MKMRRLIKALFSRKKKNAAAIYLSRFDTIDKMIREKLIGIDVKEGTVDGEGYTDSTYPCICSTRTTTGSMPHSSTPSALSSTIIADIWTFPCFIRKSASTSA